MKEERTNDIDGMRDYEDIRQVPLEPGRPASYVGILLWGIPT